MLYLYKEAFLEKSSVSLAETQNNHSIEKSLPESIEANSDNNQVLNDEEVESKAAHISLEAIKDESKFIEFPDDINNIKSL